MSAMKPRSDDTYKRIVLALEALHDECDIPECCECAILDCPTQEPLHYHHDGCPACHEEAR